MARARRCSTCVGAGNASCRPTSAGWGRRDSTGSGFYPPRGRRRHVNANTLSLYVDGTLQSTLTAPTAWRAPGHLVIGRGKYAGGPVDWVSGAIDDVRVYQEALNANDVAQLVNGGTWR